MVIGKPEWFKIRRYGGWGIQPKTWQGWVYLLIFILIFFIPVYFFKFDPIKTNIILGIWVVFLLIDVIDIMIHLKRDEREEKFEALSDRNAVWVIVTILAVGLIIETTYYGALYGVVKINYTVFIALLAGVAVKTGTFIYLERKH